MASSIAPEEQAEVTKAIMHRMMVYALHDRDNADVRTATLLHKHNLLKSAKPPETPADILAALCEKDHPIRVPVPSGPLLFCLIPGDKPESPVLEVADFIMDTKAVVRKAALQHFEDLANAAENLLTKRSRDAIQTHRAALLSSDSSAWRSAAVALVDAFKTDWLCNLAGVRQCLARRFNAGIGSFLTSVFRPEVASIDSVDLGIWNPSSQRSELEKAISQCTEPAKNLNDAIDFYYRMFGHLPLAEPFSIAGVIDKWVSREGKPGQVWKAVWEWAKDIASPLAYYHACTVFVQRPQLIPKGKHSVLWTRISHVVYMPKEGESEVGMTQAWRLRCELAKHFCHHLECRLPGAERERIACSSLWLAEQTALVFGDRPQWLRQVRSTTVAPELEISSLMSQLAHPRGCPSRLHYCVCFLPSVWRLSLLALTGERFSELRPGSMSLASRRRLRGAITTGATFCFPLHPKEPSAATYAFDRGVKAFGEAWIEFDNEAGPQEREYLTALTRALSTLGQTDTLREELRRLPADNESSQVLVSLVLRGLVYGGDAPAKQLWDCLSEEALRKKLLVDGSEMALSALVDALIEVQVQKRGNWASSLPHFFAAAGEAASGNDDREWFLFACVVLASMSTDTVSAVERLLRGTQRKRFRGLADFWLKQIDAVRDLAPPWIAGKLRALTAVLNSA